MVDCRLCLIWNRCCWFDKKDFRNGCFWSWIQCSKCLKARRRACRAKWMQVLSSRFSMFGDVGLEFADCQRVFGDSWGFINCEKRIHDEVTRLHMNEQLSRGVLGAQKVPPPSVLYGLTLLLEALFGIEDATSTAAATPAASSSSVHGLSADGRPAAFLAILSQSAQRVRMLVKASSLSTDDEDAGRRPRHRHVINHILSAYLRLQTLVMQRSELSAQSAVKLAELFLKFLVILTMINEP
eukprot:GABV01000120.1.p1 GENE.GABV01000120.1~~GABV01000120.1.p1  ORF type:complete len:240 (+),score=72.17 GABV01000120.1:636-1355(+)